MNEHVLNVRLRLIVIKNGKLLTEYNSKKDFCFYIGGHLEYGETVLEGCKREIVTLEVYSTNDVAKNLYKKLGFVEYGKLPNGITRGGKFEDSILMYKNI